MKSTSRGERRFAGRRPRVPADLNEGPVVEEPDGLPAGAGPVWAGGFAFAPDGGGAPQWSSFARRSMVLPELSLAVGRRHAF